METCSSVTSHAGFMAVFLHSGGFTHRAVLYEQLGLYLNRVLGLSPSKDLALSRRLVSFLATPFGEYSLQIASSAK